VTGGDNRGNLTKLKDMRVAFVGTGATAIQAVPALGQWAKELYVFQRTPSSVDVRGNRPTDAKWWQEYTKTPGWQKRRMDSFNVLTMGGIDEDLVGDAWTSTLQFILSLKKKYAGKNMKNGDLLQLADFQKVCSGVSGTWTLAEPWLLLLDGPDQSPRGRDRQGQGHCGEAQTLLQQVSDYVEARNHDLTCVTSSSLPDQYCKVRFLDVDYSSKANILYFFRGPPSLTSTCRPSTAQTCTSSASFALWSRVVGTRLTLRSCSQTLKASESAK
jgi:hypothetical protein